MVRRASGLDIKMKELLEVSIGHMANMRTGRAADGEESEEGDGHSRGADGKRPGCGECSACSSSQTPSPHLERLISLSVRGQDVTTAALLRSIEVLRRIQFQHRDRVTC